MLYSDFGYAYFGPISLSAGGMLEKMDDLPSLGAVPPGLEAFHGQVDSGNFQSSNLTLSAHGKFWLLLKTLDYCPRQCRWDSEHPTPLSWGFCLLFAFIKPLYDIIDLCL